MDYRKLNSFLALAKHLHFAKAAAEVCLTQPALSQHIQALEKSWGITLFDRDKRTVSLTAEGRLLLDEAERTVKRLENMQTVIREVTRGCRGFLRLGYVGTSVLEPLLVSAIRNFNKCFPLIRIDPQEYNVEQQFRLIREGELDLGIVRGPVPQQRLITCRKIHETPLSLVLPDEHPLRLRGEVGLQDVVEETLIIQDDPVGIGLAGAVLAMYASKGIVPTKIIKTRDVSTAIDLTAVGMGITFIPFSKSAALRDDVTVFNLPEPPFTTSLYLCWNASVGNINVKSFVDICTQSLPKE
ncbi:LysR family transcriptional regulator [Rosenbergiella australiborealis]|uniref:LysR family transcriptional regulator n=1 Tax=Rosenbergiella australiborealis TaxID=1544696 RepID=UPI001F4F037D|nr:LysR family transcriptional regulator [Rosenbergiella australiborealis]